MNHGGRDNKGKKVDSKGKADSLEFSWNKKWVKKKNTAGRAGARL